MGQLSAESHRAGSVSVVRMVNFRSGVFRMLSLCCRNGRHGNLLC